MLPRFLWRMCAWSGVAILAIPVVSAAQAAPHPAVKAHHRAGHDHAAKAVAQAQVTVGATASAPTQPARPLTPMEQPAQPAAITLSGGQLLVKADNSSLIQIVNQLGKSGGMTISGLDQDQRVFGDYGPGDPRQILSQLLEGAGYNVLMLGVTQDGTPRELVLSERGSAPPSPPQSFPQEQETPPQPFYQRQPPPPAGNLNFPVRSPAQMYQQMMQQREQQNQQGQQPPQ